MGLNHRIVELDDILVQAFTRRARLRMLHVMRTAEERYAALKRLPAQFQQSNVPASPIEIATTMLTEMFKAAFQQCKTGTAARPAQRQLFA